MGVRRKGSVLWIDYYVAGRRVYERLSTPDRDEAMRVLESRKAEAKAGTWKPRGDAELVADYARRWSDRRREHGVRTAATEWQRLRDFVLPAIGKRPLGMVRRADMIALVGSLRSKLAPRTIVHVYSAVRTMFVDAVAEELIVSSPCVLRVRRGELPAKRDADPRWRAGAVFTRGEVEALISDARIPWRRRVLYAVAFLGGLRLGEAVGRSWGDYDASTEPLGTLLVATQYLGAELKTERPREVPVHPLLAEMLADWRERGWPFHFRRVPVAEDLIFPKLHHAGTLNRRHVWRELQKDLATLGMRKRRMHDTRRTFVSLARADGAREDLLRWVTHGPRGVIIDAYTTPTWETLCEQVACLRIDGLGIGATAGTALRTAQPFLSVIRGARTGSRTRNLEADRKGFQQMDASDVTGAPAEIRGDPTPPAQTVPRVGTKERIVMHDNGAIVRVTTGAHGREVRELIVRLVYADPALAAVLCEATKRWLAEQAARGEETAG